MALGVRLAVLLAVTSLAEGNLLGGVTNHLCGIGSWVPGCNNAGPRVWTGNTTTSTTTWTNTSTTTTTTETGTTPVPTPAPHARNVSRWYNEENPYIIEDDVKVAKWAKDTRRDWCKDGFKGTANRDVDDLYDEMGGDNVFIQALKIAFPEPCSGNNCTDSPHIMDVIIQEAQEDWFKKKIAPLVLAILGWVFWAVLGCTYCCPRCRCPAAKERKPHEWENAMFLYGGTLVAFTISVLITMGGVNLAWGHMKDGTDNLVCTSSKILDTVLDGDQGFIGLMPALDKLWSIDSQLNTSSPLLLGLEDILEETHGIEESVVLLSDIAKLLGGMLNISANLRPSLANAQGNETLLHQCKLCASLQASVEDLEEGVHMGLGNSLNVARKEVQGTLGLSKRNELQRTLNQAFEPMTAFKDQLRVAFRPVTGDNFDASHNDLKTQFEELVYLPLIGILFWASSLVACGCCGACCCWLRPAIKQSGSEPKAAEESVPPEDAPASAPSSSSAAPASAPSSSNVAQTPSDTTEQVYSKVPRRFALTTWCCGFYFMITAFFVCFVMNTLVLPFAGFCVMIHEFDSELLFQVEPVFQQLHDHGLNMSGSQGEMLGALVDICIAGRTRARSDNLLDIIFTQEYEHSTGARTGEEKTLRQSLVEATRDPVDKAFKDIKNANNVSMAARPELVLLTDLLSTTSVAGTIVPDREAMEGHPLFQDLGLDPSLSVAYTTGTTCDDTTFDVLTIPGIRQFVTKLKAIGTGTGIITHDCIEKVDCTGVADEGQRKACDAGNAFLDLKVQLLGGDGEDIFRCDEFEYPQNGTWCDPLNMIEGENDTWEDDCLREHRTGYPFMEPKERACGLADFDVYMRSYGARLRRSAHRLDASTEWAFDRITESLRTLVFTYILDPIDEVAAGLRCSPIPPLKQEVLDGLCYQTLRGFITISNSYFISGIVSLLLTFLMYILWRVAYDNTQQNDGKVSPEPVLEASEARTKQNKAKRMANAAAMAAARVPNLRKQRSA